MFTKYEYGRIGEQCYREKLDNGLSLVVVPKKDFNRSLAFLSVNYGGADRRYKLNGQWIDTPSGVAHFLEHKAFELEGGEDAMTAMTKRGANVNAFTSSEMTAYHFDCIDGFFDNLETLIGFVTQPHFTEESVEREKGIIAQEIKMSEDDPDHVVYYGLLRGLFKKHPIKDPVVGTAESISEITAELLRSCHSSFYVPSNMTLVTVGDRDPIEVRDRAERLFSKNYSEAPAREAYKEKQEPAKKLVSSDMEVSERLFLAGAKTKSNLKGEEAVRFNLTAALSLNALLSEASPLYSELYSEGLVNETFSYDFESANGVSFFSFGGEAERAEEVVDRVIKEAERLSGGIDRAYFARRKKAAAGDELRALNSFDNLAYNLALGASGGYDYFNAASIMKDISEEDVCGFLKTWLTPERLTLSVINRKER